MSFRLFDLNPEQYEAATHGDGPLLILAGAGTGKTRVITARVAWLLSQGVVAENILAVTFTNKAAREMRERIAGMVDSAQAKALTICTFHALCLRILRKDATLLGYKNNFTIYDESDQNGLLRKIITRTAAKDEKLEPGLAKALISKAKNQGWAPPENDETLIGAVYARYERELRQLNAMDFDDLLLNAVRLLRDFPEVRAAWRDRFRHVLVDEFQDTNRLQLELTTYLAGGNPPNVCVVGDDDQSIYGWRGAEASNILEFENHFPGTRIVRLERNYRSTRPILESANHLIRHNARRHGKRLRTETEGGLPVRVLAADHDRDEAEFVANEIAERRASESLRWEDFAVLYRMNAQSRLIEENLRRLQIPYRLIGGKSFFDRREVKDILAYAACLLNPDDDVSLLRIINTPPRGIGQTTVEIALERSIAEKCSLFQCLSSEDFLSCCSTKTASAIRQFVQQLAVAREAVHLNPGHQEPVFRDFITQSRYLDDLPRLCKTPEEAENRAENVRELLRAFADYESRSNDGLRGFLDDMSLDREKKDEKEDDRPGVTLITLHAAKGLEFPHVYLIGCEDGLLPHARSKEEGTIEEERRLLYVGITRAMRSLTITHCAARLKFGSQAACKESPFLRELPEEYIERGTTREIMNQPVSEDAAAFQFTLLREMLSGTNPTD